METDSQRGRPFEVANKAACGHGAPLGNRNAKSTHGLKAKDRYSIGRLPKGCAWITTLTSGLRRDLEALTLETHGSLGPREAMYIQTAVRCEQSALLIQRWLRLGAETMSHSERLAYSQALTNESLKRDKAMDRLNLETSTDSIFDALYSKIPNAWDDEPMKDTDNHPKPTEATTEAMSSDPLNEDSDQ